MNDIDLDKLINIALEATINKIPENSRFTVYTGKYGVVNFLSMVGYTKEELDVILPDDIQVKFSGFSITTAFKRYLFPEDFVNDYRRLYKLTLNGHNAEL